VDEELQEVLGCIARPSGHFGGDPNETCRRQIQPIHERIDEADRVLRANILIQALWQQQGLESIVTADVRHAGFLDRQSPDLD